MHQHSALPNWKKAGFQHSVIGAKINDLMPNIIIHLMVPDGNRKVIDEHSYNMRKKSTIYCLTSSYICHRQEPQMTLMNTAITVQSVKSSEGMYDLTV